MGRFVETNSIRLHYLEHSGGQPPIVLMPGLSANAYVFDGLLQAGLSPRFRVIAPDLRGRGLSDKPADGYALADHAADVVGLLDALGLASAIVGGHSFGALVALYLAAHYPERVEKLVLLDIDTISAVQPLTRELIKPSLDRLGKIMSSWQEYLEAVRATYHGWWDATIESYYRGDIEYVDEGRVRSRVSPAAINQVIEHMIAEDWNSHLARIHQPAILFNALGPGGAPGTPPVIPAENARAMAAALPDCRYVVVPGNHMTMLFGKGARAVVAGMREFLERA